MPRKSRWAVPIPEVSLLTVMLGTPTAQLPDKTAFADADDPERLSMTWIEFRLWSQRLAAGLIAAGLQQTDRVVIFSPNDVMFPVVFAGVLMAGGIYSSANARYVPRELAYQLQIVEAKFLLTSRENLKVALDAAKIAGMGREHVFIFDDAPLERDGSGEDDVTEKVRHWKHLIASKTVGGRLAWPELSPEASKSTTAAIVFSSGLVTGVKASHRTEISILT